MKNQETEGILSAHIRDVRLSQVASYIRENTVVLDLACGVGFLSSYLPGGCKYYGVDRISVPNFHDQVNFLVLDLLEENSVDRIRKQFQVKPDYITCIAFLEHIPDPAEFLFKYSPLLNRKGLIIGTTPHPGGKIIHEMLSMVGFLSRNAAREHESFLGKKDLEEVASASGGKLLTYKKFLFGLNQLFIIGYL